MDTVAIEKPAPVRLAQDAPVSEPNATVMFMGAAQAGVYGSSMTTTQPKDPHAGAVRGTRVAGRETSQLPFGRLGSEIQSMLRRRRPTRYPSAPSTAETLYGDPVTDERGTGPPTSELPYSLLAATRPYPQPAALPTRLRAGLP